MLVWAVIEHASATRAMPVRDMIMLAALRGTGRVIAGVV